jgi:hypothetical protein
MIKVWVLLAHLVFANGASDDVVGRNDPDFQTQKACEETIPCQLDFLKSHLPLDTKIDMVCKEVSIGPAKDAA